MWWLPSVGEASDQKTRYLTLSGMMGWIARRRVDIVNEAYLGLSYTNDVQYGCFGPNGFNA